MESTKTMRKNPVNNNIAVVCDDLTEFFVIKSIIDRLDKLDIPVDIIVPSDSGYNNLANHTITKIKELGYSPLDNAPKDKLYKILLTPYPGLDVVKRLKYIYHIRYPYGAVSTKPNPTYLPSTRIDYDAIISFNTFDQTFLNAYGATVYPVPYWRYHSFKKDAKTHSKPVLLILPTFGADTSCANKFTDSAIDEIKKHFFVIVKAHHAIHFGYDGDQTINNLKKIADEYYDSDIPIDQLLKKADLVLSDNSGAIFEAICADTPVALFADNLNARKFHTIDTPQYIYAHQGILPHTNQAEQVLPMLLSIQPFYKKQQTLKKQLFLQISNNPYKNFIKIIKYYLALDETKYFHNVLHDAMVKEWYHDKQTILDQKTKIEELTATINNLYNSNSWKITKPLRTIKIRSKNHVKK